MWRAALLATSACALNASIAARAQAQAEGTIDYDLPAQDLGDSLLAIARLSGREVLFAPEAVRGRKAPAIKGRLSFDAAVRSALAGTPLNLEYRAGAALIRQRPTSSAAARENEAAAAPAITVTGTRIRGAGSASPVHVTTRHDLEQAGINDLADFTRILPQNYAGGQNRGIAGSGEQGGQSNLDDSSDLNLRGLGPDATLTLLNGHRFSYDGISHGVDISSIPVSAVERIEVIADGASALYGSDAVGGVANIILRRDYEGLETTARAGGSTDGGDVQQQYSLVSGHRWVTGGVMLALDHEYQTPITARQRDYTRGDDPSLYLTDRIKQTSAVLTGHQQLGAGLSLDLDGTLMDRSSFLQDPFTTTADVHVNGLVSHMTTRSYSLTPTLRKDLGPWQASLSATLADSQAGSENDNYSSGVLRLGHQLYEDNLKGVEAGAEGPLLRLPGGDARLALGGGLRAIWLHGRDRTLSGAQFITTKDFRERRQTQFAYGEVSLPLVGPDQHLPLVDRLTLSGALRYEHWNGIASETTPKLGALYQPVRGITFRATWGKSFKIPTLFQVNEIQQAILLPGFIFSPPPQPAGAPVLFLAGGAPNLRPERATTWSGTLEAKPRIIPGLDLQATYFHIDYRDRLATPFTSVVSALFNPLYDDFITYNPSASAVNALIATIPGGLINETGAPFNPAGVGAIVDASLRNSERQRIHGVDLDANYRLAVGRSGTLLLIGSTSHLDSDQQLSAGQPFLPLAGTIFHPPHWRGRAGMTWDGHGQSLSAFVNYVGPTIDNVFANLKQVSAFTTFDLTATLRPRTSAGPLRHVEMRLSALNLLNQKPHVIRIVFPGEAPYDSTNESPVGRFLGASVRKVW
jgi:outer membrane receptor protein involved in Fe transport